MRHAILGAGGVGGLMAAALVHEGDAVSVVLRPATYARHPEKIHLESAFGNFDAPVAKATSLEGYFDVVWLAVKATQLSEAIETLSAAKGRFGVVVPLLNGVDHVARLRELFGHDSVIPATIAVESERVSPGHIIHRSPFVKLAISSIGKQKLADPVQKLTRFGFKCELLDDESTLMWRKLVFLAPLALTSSASGKNAGEMKADPAWRERLLNAVRETAAVAVAEGANVDLSITLKTVEGFPPSTRSSMQKDLEAGRPPELEAIGGPILRDGEKHGIPTPTIRQLIAQIERRIATESTSPA